MNNRPYHHMEAMACTREFHAMVLALSSLSHHLQAVGCCSTSL